MTFFAIEDLERYSICMRTSRGSAVGDTVIRVRSMPEAIVGEEIVIDVNGDHPEIRTVTSQDTKYLTIPALEYAHEADVAVGRALISLDSQGWIGVIETFTYGSSDDPAFTLTIVGDHTSKYSAGMKIKLTQTTVKYFIITKVAYSTNTTTLTIFGGDDYDLANAAITSPYFSTQKSPHGFPLNPDIWKVEASLTGGDAEQLGPTQHTWYNLGSFSLDVPIGCWSLSYEAIGRVQDDTTTTLDFTITLSKQNNAADDDELTAGGYLGYLSGASGVQNVYNYVSRTKHIECTSKTTYYLLARARTAGVELMRFAGSTDHGYSVIRATCAYL